MASNRPCRLNDLRAALPGAGTPAALPPREPRQRGRRAPGPQSPRRVARRAPFGRHRGPTPPSFRHAWHADRPLKTVLRPLSYKLRTTPPFSGHLYGLGNCRKLLMLWEVRLVGTPGFEPGTP